MSDPFNINPYAAPPPSAPAAPIMPTSRLRRLGATDEQLVTLGAAWDEMDLDDRRVFVDNLAVLTDPELVAVLHGEGALG